MTGPSLQELVESVESRGLPLEEASEVLGIAVEGDGELCQSLAYRFLSLRQMRGALDAPSATKSETSPATAITPERRARETSATGRRRHASARVAMVTQAWSDLLATKVPMPETGTKIAVRDMTVDQLTRTAHALYDTHERLHALAEACTAAGALTPADLPKEALAEIERAVA